MLSARGTLSTILFGGWKHLTHARQCQQHKTAYTQVRLGYQGKAGHRAFRRLRTTLEDQGYIQEVVGTIGADSNKPVVCIKCASALYLSCIR